MDGTSNMHGRIEKCLENFGLKNYKRKGPDGRITLKFILEE
jgi:hypothetical protein